MNIIKSKLNGILPWWVNLCKSIFHTPSSLCDCGMKSPSFFKSSTRSSTAPWARLKTTKDGCIPTVCRLPFPGQCLLCAPWRRAHLTTIVIHDIPWQNRPKAFDCGFFGQPCIALKMSPRALGQVWWWDAGQIGTNPDFHSTAVLPTPAVEFWLHYIGEFQDISKVSMDKWAFFLLDFQHVPFCCALSCGYPCLPFIEMIIHTVNHTPPQLEVWSGECLGITSRQVRICRRKAENRHTKQTVGGAWVF